ncbi:MAG: hypothetical protein PWQ55_117 [Chloroflexota bacterium]|nr:hypothetical protein [Chloroflexota bacterium]
MCISELKKAASIKSGITTRAIAYRSEKIKEKYGPLPNEVAYGIVAQLVGVDVSKIIPDLVILEEIRNQLDRIAEDETGLPKQKPKTIVKTRVVKIADDIKLSDPILDDQVIKDAKEMTVYYAKLYVFENSVREFINIVLSKSFGPNWWNPANVNKDLRDKVQERIKKEAQNPWHGGRGAHPIYYTDLLDLEYLFRRHWDGIFENYFPRFEWVSEKLKQLSFSRNVVDHHNPLTKTDRERLSFFLRDWQSQINSIKSKI